MATENQDIELKSEPKIVLIDRKYWNERKNDIQQQQNLGASRNFINWKIIWEEAGKEYPSTFVCWIKNYFWVSKQKQIYLITKNHNFTMKISAEMSPNSILI